VPDIADNRVRWQRHKWSGEGDEWSPGRSAAGTALLWHRTLLPRIFRFVPTGTILEIAPGFGRWTQYLHPLCERLIVVDLAERCIAHCRERFASVDRIEYHVNDGASLAMVADRSVDFIFSFDSLVHAETDAIGAYLAQAARKLKPGGAGFIHHSNLAAFVSRATGRVSPLVWNRNWRAASVSAASVRAQCAAAGLACASQELINWIGGGPHADRHRVRSRDIPLTDCLTVFTAAGAGARTADGPVIPNYGFADEWRETAAILGIYGTADPLPVSAASVRDARVLARKLATATGVARRDGVAALLTLASERLLTESVEGLAAMKARTVGLATRFLLGRRLS